MPSGAPTRWFRRLALALRRPNVDLVVPDAQVHLPGRLHDPHRASRVLAFLHGEGLLRRQRGCSARVPPLSPSCASSTTTAISRPWSGPER